jgi:hypothetical protein
VQSDSHSDPVRNTKIKPKVPLNGLSFFVRQRRLAPIMADIAIDTLKIFTMSGSRVVHRVAAQVRLFLKSINQIHLHFLFFHQLPFYRYN